MTLLFREFYDNSLKWDITNLDGTEKVYQFKNSTEVNKILTYPWEEDIRHKVFVGSLCKTRTGKLYKYSVISLMLDVWSIYNIGGFYSVIPSNVQGIPVGLHEPTNTSNFWGASSKYQNLIGFGH